MNQTVTTILASLLAGFAGGIAGGVATAARPGFSNHQSGHALDLNAREPWHWEYWP